jgi:8-amino-7-oxononanoate synthase
MNACDSELELALSDLRERGLYRELRKVDSPQQLRIQIGGESFLNFSSNDYLGLANHPRLKEASIRALERYGSGSGASRLVCGSLAPHHELEESLAMFKGAQAALTFSTGYSAALGTICALLGTEDIIILDKLVHACIVDAARLCGAKIRVFKHNDLDNLETLLKWASKQQTSTAGSPGRRVLVVTETVFSMDGDVAPLKGIVELKDKYGAWLMIDEAHATGLYGPNRRGLAEETGVSDRVEIQMGTLGKALGAAGGFVCGSRTLIEFLVNKARSFIFSTAPVPAAAAAAMAGIELVRSSVGAERCRTLWERLSELPKIIPTLGANLVSAIVPIHVGDETAAMTLAAALRGRGLFIPAIRYPTVARGHARLRVALTAEHSRADLEQLGSALKQEMFLLGKLR